MTSRGEKEIHQNLFTKVRPPRPADSTILDNNNPLFTYLLIYPLTSFLFISDNKSTQLIHIRLKKKDIHGKSYDDWDICLTQ